MEDTKKITRPCKGSEKPYKISRRKPMKMISTKSKIESPKMTIMTGTNHGQKIAPNIAAMKIISRKRVIKKHKPQRFHKY